MSPQMNGEQRDAANAADLARPATAPLASVAAADRPILEAINTEGVARTTVTQDDAQLAPLFTREAATDLRSRWDVVQRSFVDDPLEAVRAGDELVAQVIKNLTESFSSQRSQLESEMNQTDQPSTENLRLALRHYRSFFERLLSM